MVQIDSETGGLAFGLTCMAGMCTTLGASVVFNERLAAYANKKFLAGSLGISAGVMLYVSFIEIFFKSQGAFVDYGYEEGTAHTLAALCFFGGIALGNLLDSFVHWLESERTAPASAQSSNDHDMDGMFEGIKALKAAAHAEDVDFFKDANPKDVEEPNSNALGRPLQPLSPPPQAVASPALPGAALSHGSRPHANMTTTTVPLKEDGASGTVSDDESEQSKALVKMGMMTALAIGIHNFPEGLATFVGTLDDPAVGMGLAIAIGIHNIPEGLCVSIPIYYATKNRCQAFKWAFISGISEPIGAGLGWLVLANTMDDRAYGVVFGLVAGLMVNICIHELLPTAQKYDPEDKVMSKSVIAGMFIMALSLVCFQVA